MSQEHAEEFERGFRDHELQTHRDLYERGLLVMSTLTRVDHITTNPVEGAVQYLVVAIFNRAESSRSNDREIDQPDCRKRREAAIWR